ncbi:Egd1p [Saccharomyces cerevisiae x Saccharomyces kudriavzevii VIN7]|uniref:Nascent polypeptide-associated complex subunit beta n=1 Tax=Saccharomyces cerevisiae x Saccharomyces kudriavzevii (strain VIN7) TaxID=1095631 RepID=H0H268_SACCK|nr:Egd1p [Saccharomyces cerevisiae x Saccharomyces kudriavzevii VIN7]
MPIDQEKLAKLQKLSANNKVGGTRRKFNKKAGSSAGANKDDTKLQSQLAKLHAVTIDNVAEANFFKEDGKVMHFNKVGVQVAAQHNTSVFYGLPQERTCKTCFQVSSLNWALKLFKLCPNWLPKWKNTRPRVQPMLKRRMKPFPN